MQLPQPLGMAAACRLRVALLNLLLLLHAMLLAVLAVLQVLWCHAVSAGTAVWDIGKRGVLGAACSCIFRLQGTGLCFCQQLLQAGGQQDTLPDTQLA